MKIIDNAQRDRLVLYPVCVDRAQTDPGKLQRTLMEIGLVDGVLPGTEFMRLLTFMGCSPSITAAGDSAGYNRYSVNLVCAGENILLASERLRSPVCPHCGGRDQQSPAVDQVHETDSGIRWTCPGCNERFAIADINWRHRLGVARNYVVIHGVFEGEVIPSDRLLDHLARASNCDWSYCYC